MCLIQEQPRWNTLVGFSGVNELKNSADSCAREAQPNSGKKLLKSWHTKCTKRIAKFSSQLKRCCGTFSPKFAVLVFYLSISMHTGLLLLPTVSHASYSNSSPGWLIKLIAIGFNCALLHSACCCWVKIPWCTSLSCWLCSCCLQLVAQCLCASEL